MARLFRDSIIVLVALILCGLPAGAEGTADTPEIRGTASWYSVEDPGVLPTTANREQFDDTQLTCAMWDVPFNTMVRVTNVSNGRSVIVRVNDRGPARRLVAEGRLIDLTKEAFSQIADLDKGLTRVKLEILTSTASTE